MFVLDEEPFDDLDAHESEEHAELETALFNAADHIEKGHVLARAETAWRSGRLSRKAFQELLKDAGQRKFWNMFLLRLPGHAKWRQLFASGVPVGSNSLMEHQHTTPVSIATAEMRGWWVEMRDTSFVLCGPHITELGRSGYFQRCLLGYRFPAADIDAASAAMGQASYWFRKEWSPDFTLPHPYGIDRGVHVVRTGDWIDLQCPEFAETADETDFLEFTYTELPGLRAAMDRRARPRRKRLKKEHDADPEH